MSALNFGPCPAPRADLGRADLLRALLHDGEAGLASMAQRLGFETRPRRVSLPELAPTLVPAPEPEFVKVRDSPSRTQAPAARPPTVPEVEDDPGLPLEPLRFWRVVRAELSPQEAELLKLAPPEKPPEVGVLQVSDLEVGDARPPEDPPLVSSPRLWRALDDRLRTVTPRAEVDVERLVRLWARGESVSRLPRRVGLRHCRVLLLLDFRQDMLPFGSDQEALYHVLVQRLGWDAVRVVVWSGGDFDLGAPSPDEQVLAVTDFGASGDPDAQQAWYRLGLQLARSGVRCHALVPTSMGSLPREFLRLWSAVSWSSPEKAESVGPIDRLEDLLCLASPGVRWERGLVRSLVGLLPGAGAGLEARLWGHEAVEERNLLGLALRPEATRSRLSRFCDLPEALQRGAIEVFHSWHAKSRPELWAEEVARLLSVGVPEEWIEDVEAAQQLFLKLARRVELGPQDDELDEGADLHFGRFRRRVPRQLWRNATYRQALGAADAAWRERQEDRPESTAGTLPEALHQVERREDWVRWSLRRVGDGLRIDPFQPTEPPPEGSTWLGDLEARGRHFEVGDGVGADQLLEPGELLDWEWDGDVLLVSSDVETLHLEPFNLPSWASAAGRDGYGLWAAFEVKGVEQRMRWIPPGRFLMGSPEDEMGRVEREGPQHWVVLTEGYWLAETPCLQELWRVVMGRNPSRFFGPEYPVERVSWEDCQHFINRLNFEYRDLELALPSEAEWEYACRAGTRTATWSGVPLDELAWFGGNSGFKTAISGTKPANPWGLYDLLGNVYEWCWDLYSSYTENPVVDPEGATDGSFRVIRGGSWDSFAREVRAAYRYGYSPGNRFDDVGFRLSRGPQDPGRGAAGAERLGLGVGGGSRRQRSRA